MWRRPSTTTPARSLDDRLPRTLAGAVVSLADKLDNVVAGFAAGLAPTGSSDPFGLRRSAQGAIKLMIEILPPISFKVLLDASCELFAEQRPSGGALEAFWVERLAFYLARRSRYDTVKAVLADPAHEREALASPAGAFARSEALERFRDTEDFVALAQAAKRVRNILSKSAAEAELGCESVEERLLEAGPERDLFGKYAEAASRLRRLGGRDTTIADWIGMFAPRHINVIPLFEDKKSMLGAHTTVHRYLLDKQFPYQRVFLARSDPAHELRACQRSPAQQDRPF